jgi:diguanylate cyclase (GGDEF)-like protein
MLIGFERFIARLSVAGRVAFGLLVVTALGAVDWMTGTEVSFSIFYLAPVVFVTWFVGRKAGLAFAALCAALWGILDVAGGTSYTSAWIPFWNSIMRFGFFVITLLLVEGLKEAHAREWRLARRDPLTEVFNSREFDAMVAREIERTRHTGRPFALAYIDLDRFKSVNDSFGHAAGDELLRSVAAELTRSVRAMDAVARLGGDEFGVLLPDCGLDQAATTLERVLPAVWRAIQSVPGLPPGVGMTTGAVVFEEAPAVGLDAIGIADRLMYEGKTAGRGRAEIRSWRDAGLKGELCLLQPAATDAHADAGEGAGDDVESGRSGR